MNNNDVYDLYWNKGYNPMPQYIEYQVTGVDYSGKRYKVRTANLHYASGFHPYSGSLWGVLANGKRKLLKRL